MGARGPKPNPNKGQLIEAILEGMSNGESMREMCRRNGVGFSTFLQWVDCPEYSERYTRAREALADVHFEALDDLMDKAESATTAVEVAGLRLKADTIKWKLSKMAPRRYGDKLQTEVTGANGGPLAVSLEVSFVSPGQNKG